MVDAHDQWYIKKSGDLTHSYTWKRHPRGLEGVVGSDDKRHVVSLRDNTVAQKASKVLYSYSMTY
jgi:hypothetical protein